MIKKLFMLIIFLIFSINAFAEICGVVITKEDPLNIRESADKSSIVIERASKDSALRILDKTNNWYKVKLNSGKIGYGIIDYIKKLTSESTEVCGVVNTENTSLNIRKQANKDSPIIYKAVKGSNLRILQQGEWYKVLLNNGKIGYAHSDYVKIN